MYSIIISKEYNHFTSAHFIVFDERNREMLHGHNYYVQVELSGSVQFNGKLIDVNEVKPTVKKICDELDHLFILPKNNKFIDIDYIDDNVVIKHNDDKFIFPKKDVKALNIENSTMENLAEYIANEIQLRLNLDNIEFFSVTVEETKGQSARFIKTIEDKK